ncbi:MAG: site-2 protease family protein [Vicinamibacteria bacterium]
MGAPPPDGRESPPEVSPDLLPPLDFVGWPVPPPVRPSAWKRWGRNLLLFALTAASIFLTGGLRSGELPDGRTLWALDVASGLRLVAGLLAILLAHEMGHYLMCRRHGVDATLPFFIPAPFLSMVGTLGAFIRIRAPIPHRRALFDIGVAGPLAGFVVCLPILLLGMREATLVPTDPKADGIFLGEPLLFQGAERLFYGHVPDSLTLNLGPLGLAAWFGLFLTALNLIPIGQLDGGHVTYALLRERAALISKVGSWVCVALVYFGPNWILWAVLVRVLGRRHPRTLDDDEPPGRVRAWVGAISLGVFVLCFVPNPIIWSWRDFFDAVGLSSLLRRYGL